MKKFLFAILITAISSVCYAQRIKVHQGNNINSFLLSDVDSITHDGNESVTVYYASQPSTFSVNNVDCLSINSERIECHNIISEQLNGWDEGIFSISNDGEDFYIVSKTETDEDGKETVIICINSFANDVLEKTINFIFDKEGNLQEIVTAGYQFKAQKYLDEFVFAVYKNGEYIDSFSVPCDVINENGTITNNSSRRRSYSNPIFNCKGKISLPKIKDFAGKAGGILKPVGDALGTAVNLDEGKYGEILMDFVVGGLISLADLPLVAGIIAEEGIKGLLKFIYEQDKKRLLGDAQIEITSVKRTSETAITVEGTISNISSIPSTIMVGSMSDGYFDEIPNKVYWGIAEGKSGQPGMYLNDNSTGTMQISSDKFTYTFYIERVPGQVLYFRPFLAPEVSMQSIYTCIRYGERKEFIDVDVELSNFKQVKCLKEGGKYKVQFNIDGSIPGLFQELSGWGIDVRTKSGSFEQRFNAKETDDYYPPVSKSFTCDIIIEENDITDYGMEKIAEITITPYVSFWNNMPPISFLDAHNYSITIKVGLCPDSHHPHVIDLGLPSGTKWACCNLGGYSPSSYGGYYTWGETREKTWYSEVYSGYSRPSNNIDLNKYNGHIAGTNEDAAYVLWGDAWQMPSMEQFEELRNNCIYEWTTEYGNGCLFISTNPATEGNRIFLPAAGGIGNKKRFYAGTYGRYLSDTGNPTYSEGNLITFYFLCIDKDGNYWNWDIGDSHYGHSIRPVAR